MFVIANATSSQEGENSDSSDDEDKRSADLHSLNRRSPPLFSLPVAGSSGSPAGNTRSGAIARRAMPEKEQKKRKK